MACKSGNFLKKITEHLKCLKGYDQVMKNVKIISAEDGKCTAEFTVDDDHMNFSGTLHGGFTSTLVDNITTYALWSKVDKRGVSVHLYVDYMRAAKKCDTIVVDAKVIKAGKILAVIDCELRNKNDNSLIAKGGQTKYIPADPVKKD